MCSSDLRKYLDAKGELPEDSLGAGAPINVRSPEEYSDLGNRISAMTLSLRTDIDDPLARLQAVHAASSRGKEFSDSLGRQTPGDIVEGLYYRVGGLGVRALSAASRLRELPLPLHTIVSNVPGPLTPIYLGGARLDSIFGLGPLVDNVGL